MSEMQVLIEIFTLAVLKAAERWQQENRIATFYPGAGPLRRERYPRHLEFFRAGARYRERAVIAANRIGKTDEKRERLAGH